MSYISRIEIDALWRGRHHVVWQLHPGVNILSGVNGVGKSTILRRLEERLHTVHSSGEITVDGERDNGVTLQFSPKDVRSMRFDIIHPYAPSELAAKLDETQQRFTAFLAREDRRDDILMTFYNILDDLFSDTGKTIVRDIPQLSFHQDEEVIGAHLLSSGEKHMLFLLVALLCQQGEPCVVVMDEPEYSLHFEWQKQLLNIVMRMNPEAQVILTTHSPAVIMDGWADCVTDVSDIVDG